MLVSIDDVKTNTLYYVTVIEWPDGLAKVIDTDGNFMETGGKGKYLCTTKEEAYATRFPKSIFNKYCMIVGLEYSAHHDDWSVVSVEHSHETSS